MSHSLIVTGEPGMLLPDHLMVTLACMTTTALIGFVCLLIFLRRIYIRGLDARHFLLVLTALLLLGELANNGLALTGIQIEGVVDLFPYYLARSLCFLPSGASHTMVILNRITLLVVVPSTRRKFLIISTIAVIAADLVAIGGMWDATLKVAQVGTLDEWQWRWRFPFYGVAASATFPIINVAACTWSLRAAFLMSRGGGSNGDGNDGVVISLGAINTFTPDNQPEPPLPNRAVTLVPSASRLLPPPSLNSSTAPLDSGSTTGDSPPPKQGVRFALSTSSRRMLASAASLSLRPRSTRHMSPTEASLTRSFWYLTIIEMLMWFTFMAIIGSSTPSLPLWTRNSIYTFIAMAGLAVETGFEKMYRFELARAKSRGSSSSRSRQGSISATARAVPVIVVGATSRAAMNI